MKQQSIRIGRTLGSVCKRMSCGEKRVGKSRTGAVYRALGSMRTEYQQGLAL